MCKAAVMGDKISHHKIIRESTPAACKKLGRKVKGFNGDIWKKIECSVAFNGVHQKFTKTPSLRNILLKQPSLYAEMTQNDGNWGTGVNWDNPMASDPSRWPGTNTFGWALNEVRNALLAGHDAVYLKSHLAEQEDEIMDLPNATTMASTRMAITD